MREFSERNTSWIGHKKLDISVVIEGQQLEDKKRGEILTNVEKNWIFSLDKSVDDSSRKLKKL